MATMNYQQVSRYNKIQYERFYLLNIKNQEDKYIIGPGDILGLEILFTKIIQTNTSKIIILMQNYDKKTFLGNNSLI